VERDSNLGRLSRLNGAIVVSAGGHLEQALRRVNQLGISESVTFFTPRNTQTESKLSAFDHFFVRNVPSRDIAGLVRATFDLHRKVKKQEYDYILSTGAALAIAGYFVSKLRGIDFYYIESIARQDKPSVTGKILQLMRVKNRFTESHSTSFRKWKRIDSLFAEYHFDPKEPIQNRSLKLFVTMGTVHQFKFQRMVDLVDSILEDGDEVIWQIGDLSTAQTSGQFFREMSDTDFTSCIQSADAVISHAGVGSVLKILDSGKVPILIPRLSKYQEHVDDHQFEISMMLQRLSLGILITDTLTRQDILYVANQNVTVRRQ
jgi:UDP-N-acetylglucosamine--N-acetylmuramyl-(pentapeptide) pyrophosphoryl-undecaprenol N-acetylglucosamine transferase